MRLHIFIPDIGTQSPGMARQEQRWSGLTASAPVLDVSTPGGTNGLWSPLQSVSVAQKNIPLNIFSSTV